MSGLEEQVKAKKVRRVRVSIPISLDEPKPADKPVELTPDAIEEKVKAKKVRKVRVSMPISLETPKPVEPPKPAVVFPVSEPVPKSTPIEPIDFSKTYRPKILQPELVLPRFRKYRIQRPFVLSPMLYRRGRKARTRFLM